MTNLESLGRGVALPTTPNGNGVVPQATIDTLADILGACVNSAGPSSTPCSMLFANAMNGNSQPAETATAAINIAHNPGRIRRPLRAAAVGSAIPADAAVPTERLYHRDHIHGGRSGWKRACPDGTRHRCRGQCVGAKLQYQHRQRAQFQRGCRSPALPYPAAAGWIIRPAWPLTTMRMRGCANFNGADISEFNAQGPEYLRPSWIQGRRPERALRNRHRHRGRCVGGEQWRQQPEQNSNPTHRAGYPFQAAADMAAMFWPAQPAWLPTSTAMCGRRTISLARRALPKLCQAAFPANRPR